MQYIFLSHDVDWRRQGPPIEHVLARRDRFDPEIFEKTKPENLYSNIPEYIFKSFGTSKPLLRGKLGSKKSQN